MPLAIVWPPEDISVRTITTGANQWQVAVTAEALRVEVKGYGWGIDTSLPSLKINK